MPHFHLKIDLKLENLLSDLSAAVQNTLQAEGVEVSEKVGRTIESRIKNVLQNDLVLSDICGLAVVCSEAEKIEPWSHEANAVLEAEEEKK